MAVPILKQGPFLIASIQAALTDTDVIRLQDDVMVQVGRYRSRGIVVDVTALDVMDSFVSRSLRGIAHMTRLRGAETVIVGIQPEVAFAMVQLGMQFEDVLTARQRARELAGELELSSTDQTLLATAISEVARNITTYATRGEVLLRIVHDGDGRDGIEVVASDQGPGIADVDLAMQDGYTSGGGLGLGLPGARRLVDEFDIETAPSQGTTVTLVKWSRAR